jgi:hypothetical protein
MCKTTWKQIFIVLTYANMNMKITWQSYGARSCLRLVLNRLKKMKDVTFIYTPLGIYFKEVSKEASMCALNK